MPDRSRARGAPQAWPWMVLAVVLLADALRTAYVLTLRATPWSAHLVGRREEAERLERRRAGTVP